MIDDLDKAKSENGLAFMARFVSVIARVSNQLPALG